MRYRLTEEDIRLISESQKNIERIIANSKVDDTRYRYIGKDSDDYVDPRIGRLFKHRGDTYFVTKWFNNGQLRGKVIDRCRWYEDLDGEYSFKASEITLVDEV